MFSSSIKKILERNTLFPLLQKFFNVKTFCFDIKKLTLFFAISTENGNAQRERFLLFYLLHLTALCSVTWTYCISPLGV